MGPPEHPKLYHLVHVDRLESIVRDGRLFCDAAMAPREGAGTVIGMGKIKTRRLGLPLQSHPGLTVGGCVPFYFCPRSVMLYIISQRNHLELTYRGGQEPIVHLELDIKKVAAWAEVQRLRWCFTLSNAGARYFEERGSLAQLVELNWEAIVARRWAGDLQEGKQAEFLVEREVDWSLVERIGVFSDAVGQRALTAISCRPRPPRVEVLGDWYY